MRVSIAIISNATSLNLMFSCTQSVKDNAATAVTGAGSIAHNGILLITLRPFDVHCLNILKLWCPSQPLSIVKAGKKLEDRTPYDKRSSE